MCPACLTTLALISVASGSAGGLGAVFVTKVRTTPAAQAPTHSAPAETPASEEEVQ